MFYLIQIPNSISYYNSHRINIKTIINWNSKNPEITTQKYQIDDYNRYKNHHLHNSQNKKETKKKQEEEGNLLHYGAQYRAVE